MVVGARLSISDLLGFSHTENTKNIQKAWPCWRDQSEKNGQTVSGWQEGYSHLNNHSIRLCRTEKHLRTPSTSKLEVEELWPQKITSDDLHKQPYYSQKNWNHIVVFDVSINWSSWSAFYALHCWPMIGYLDNLSKSFRVYTVYSMTWIMTCT